MAIKHTFVDDSWIIIIQYLGWSNRKLIKLGDIDTRFAEVIYRYVKVHKNIYSTQEGLELSRKYRDIIFTFVVDNLNWREVTTKNNDFMKIINNIKYINNRFNKTHFSKELKEKLREKSIKITNKPIIPEKEYYLRHLDNTNNMYPNINIVNYRLFLNTDYSFFSNHYVCVYYGEPNLYQKTTSGFHKNKKNNKFNYPKKNKKYTKPKHFKTIKKVKRMYR